MTITISSIDGEFVPDVSQVITSGVSYYYECIFTRSNVYTVLFSNETNGDGVLFTPVKISICKTNGKMIESAVLLTVEGKATANVYNNLDIDIPKFIRQASIETVGLEGDSGNANYSLQVLFRRLDISSKKQIIHAV